MLLNKNKIDTSKLQDFFYNPKYDISLEKRKIRAKKDNRKYIIKTIDETNIDIIETIEKGKKELLQKKSEMLKAYLNHNETLIHQKHIDKIVNLRLKFEQIKSLVPYQRQIIIKKALNASLEKQIRNYIYLIDDYKLEDELKEIRHELVKRLFDLKEKECLEKQKIKRYE